MSGQGVFAAASGARSKADTPQKQEYSSTYTLLLAIRLIDKQDEGKGAEVAFVDEQSIRYGRPAGRGHPLSTLTKAYTQTVTVPAAGPGIAVGPVGLKGGQASENPLLEIPAIKDASWIWVYRALGLGKAKEKAAVAHAVDVAAAVLAGCFLSVSVSQPTHTATAELLPRHLCISRTGKAGWAHKDLITIKICTDPKMLPAELAKLKSVISKHASIVTFTTADSEHMLRPDSGYVSIKPSHSSSIFNTGGHQLESLRKRPATAVDMGNEIGAEPRQRAKVVAKKRPAAA